MDAPRPSPTIEVSLPCCLVPRAPCTAWRTHPARRTSLPSPPGACRERSYGQLSGWSLMPWPRLPLLEVPGIPWQRRIRGRQWEQVRSHKKGLRLSFYLPLPPPDWQGAPWGDLLVRRSGVLGLFPLAACQLRLRASFLRHSLRSALSIARFGGRPSLETDPRRGALGDRPTPSTATWPSLFLERAAFMGRPGLAWEAPPGLFNTSTT